MPSKSLTYECFQVHKDEATRLTYSECSILSILSAFLMCFQHINNFAIPIVMNGGTTQNIINFWITDGRKNIQSFNKILLQEFSKLIILMETNVS